MKKLKFITLTLAIIITLPMLQSCLDDNDHSIAFIGYQHYQPNQ